MVDWSLGRDLHRHFRTIIQTIQLELNVAPQSIVSIVFWLQYAASAFSKTKQVVFVPTHGLQDDRKAAQVQEVC
jgi:hypothetical protein